MLIFCVVAATGTAIGQPEATGPAFEVASVKPSPRIANQNGLPINLGTVEHGTVNLQNTTLSECIRWAYGLSSEEQISGPDWIRDRELRVDIVAKAPPETALEQIRLMGQRLLAERFQLQLHTEKRPIAHLELGLFKGGPPRTESQEPGPSIFRGFGYGRVAYDHLLMGTLAMLLSRQLRETVVDRSGLDGYFNVNLAWTPDGPAPADAYVPDRPDLFHAIQQQLGLKLERSKAPIDVLVIDHAERVPSGN